MLSLLPPSEAQEAAVLRRAADAAPSYGRIGMTRGDAAAPPGFERDRYHTVVGRGGGVFAALRRAIGRWEMFRQGWAEIRPPGAPVAEGTVVVVRAHALGFWMLSPARVVYTLDEEEEEEGRRVRRFGFAYGTLPGHVERGEERFLARWDLVSDEVSFEIVALSRPAHPLAWLGYPLVRRTQQRFGHGALAAVRRAVETGR